MTSPSPRPFAHRHLLGIQELSAEDIVSLLDRADSHAERLDRSGRPDHAPLNGAVVVNLFFEHSTRTRTSFEMAAKRLGADVVNFDIETSSLSKGESFSDTIRTIAAMRPDAIVVRHSEYNAPRTIAGLVDCPVVNAGDSWREHPTQALLDALTIRRRFGTLVGLKVAICGDIAHSRVAASNMILLRKLDVEVNVVAPPALKPEKFVDGVNVFETMQDGLKNCDVVMMLRNQKERMQAGLIESDDAFFKDYGLTYEKLAYAKRNAMVMHPGPMNRGVEIDGDVADDPARSLILEQVKNGVPTRMAVLEQLLTGRP